MSSPIDTPPATVAGLVTPAPLWPINITAPLRGSNLPTLAPSTTIRSARAMLYELMRSMPRATGLVFGWCVTDANFDLEPTIIKAQFGDGYAQRRPAGINTQSRKWNLSMKNIDATTAYAVLDFLSARNGVDVFNWTPPRTDTAEDVICPSWNFAYGDLLDDGSRLFSITMKFEEAFV